MPRGGYDCTGAAPGSFASRLGRQMYPCGGGNTPRASQLAVFPGGAMPYQPAAAHVQAMGMAVNYGYSGAATPQTGLISQHQHQPQQQRACTYMSGPGFAPSQPQVQTYTPFGYAPSTMHTPMTAAVAGGAANPGLVYASNQAVYHQQASVYGAPQAPYYRHS
ncbi:hypothetical protein IF1G_04340 [Cordyceps javanica]|uniref:Uncharacterized protein n=1 Tax=Cordyceps javanica TaxID=43265 RepID=A0A545V5V9_9HYPO|nr:hypothetical protein IF1G_04340 [Cordyceps javanica]TQW08346.1 hypothetical protein IF2G_04222 [Cordyceps javanica]